MSKFAVTSLLLYCLGLLVYVNVAHAQATSTKSNPPQPAWAVGCTGQGAEAKLTCRMTQTLVVTKTRRPLLVTTITPPTKPGEDSTMLFRLPHGIYLPAGVSIKVDGGKSFKIEIQTADANGSYAGIGLTAPLLVAMIKGNTLTVTMKSTAKKDVAIPLTLSGFGAAYKRITTVN